MKLVIRDLAAREILAAVRYYRDAAGPWFRKAWSTRSSEPSSAYSRLRADSRSVTSKSSCAVSFSRGFYTAPTPTSTQTTCSSSRSSTAGGDPVCTADAEWLLTLGVARDDAAWCRGTLSEQHADSPFPNRCPTPCHFTSPAVTSRRRDRIRDAREISHSRVRSRLFSRSAANPASPTTILNTWTRQSPMLRPMNRAKAPKMRGCRMHVSSSSRAAERRGSRRSPSPCKL